MRATLALRCVAVLSTLLLSIALAAQSTTWTGAASTAWSDPANWSAGVPSQTIHATIPAGTANAPSTAGGAAVCLGLTVDGGAILTVDASGTLTAHGTVFIAGSASGTGVVEMAGNTSANLSGGGSLPALRIAKTAGSVILRGDVTVSGDLRLVSGTLIVSQLGLFTLTVNGDAFLDGGRLQNSSVGTLDVAGNVTVGALGSANWPNVTCGGNWTGNGGGPYSGGTVTLDGGNQTIGGSAPTFPNLTIAAGSTTTLTADATGSGNLTVAGTLAATTQTSAWDGALAMSGSFDVGSGDHSFARNIDVSGTTSGAGAVVATGSLSATLVGGGTLPALRIEKSSSLVLQGDVTVSGDLRLVSGTLIVSQLGLFTLTVNGDAYLDGGRLQNSSVGTLDVAGNVTVGALGSANWPNVTCGGNWTGNGGGPYSGSTVTLDGGNQTIGGSAPTFPNLTIAAGSATTLTADATGSGDLTVAGSLTATTQTSTWDGALAMSGSFDVGSGDHSFARNINVSGTASGAGAVVATGNLSATLVGGGTLPALRIEKSSSLSLRGDVTVSGDLRLVSGTLIVSQLGLFTLTVNGDAYLDGGRLQSSSVGTLDVAGNVTVGALGSANWPNVTCGGNWTGNGGGPYSGSTVTLDGGNQTIGGSAPTFPNLTIAAGSATTLTADATGSGDLTVAGSLAATTQTSTWDGALAMSGSFDVGSGDHSFARNIDVSGTTSGAGAVVATGSVNASLRGGGTLPALRIEKSSSLVLQGDVTVSGDLRLVSGTLIVSQLGLFTLTVNGDAYLDGGRLQNSSVGTLDVAGNVTVGALGSANWPNVTCGGNWTGNGGGPYSGSTVTLDGGNQTIGGSAPTFPNLTIAAGSATTLTADATGSGDLTVAGSLTATTQTSTWDGALAMSGSFDVGSGDHSFARNINVSGTTSGAGAVVATGSVNASLRGGGTLPALRIEKSSSLVLQGDVTVSGDLRLVSGTLIVSQFGLFTLTVNGDAFLDGGRLQNSSVGTLDVAGNVTVGALGSANWPNVTCGGNWTGNGGGPYSGSTVTLDGGNQTIGGSAPTFPNLTIAAGSATTLTADATGSGDLTVAGSLAATTQTSAWDGALAMSGSFDVGSGDHSFARNINVSGTVSGAGTVVATGNLNAILRGGGTLPALRIEKSSSLVLQGDVTVSGDLRLVSGTLIVSQFGLFTLDVGGDASFEGGALQRSSDGVLTTQGSMTFSGSTVVSPPTLQCSANWISDAAFAPTSGAVIFDGSGSLSTTSGGPLAFHDVQVAAGVRTVADPVLELAANSLTIDAGAALDAVSSTLSFSVPSLAPAGTLAVGPGGVLALPAIPIQTAGLSAIGLPSSPARVTSDGSGRYGLTVTGTIAASNAEFDGLDANGLVLPASTTIAAEPNDFRAVTLRDPAQATGACLLTIERPTATNLWYTTFDNPSQTTGVFNVVAPATTAPITFVNFGGDLGGDAFESDPGDLVSWSSQVLTQLTSYSATAGIDEVTLDWATTDETGVASYQLGRGSSASGPFSVVATLPATGPGSYQHVDTGLTAGTRYFYQLAEVVAVNGAVQELSIADATPLSASSQLGVGTAPTSPVTAGDPWPDFTVRIENGAGQLNPAATDDVTLVVTGGPAIAGQLTQTAVAGVATFTGLSATGVGTITFDLTASGLTSVTGLTVGVEPADASQLAFSVAPAPTIVAGQAMPRIEIQALDAYGNLDSDYAGTIAVTASGTGVLSGGPTAVAAGGVAEFVGLSYDVAEAITLDFAAANLPVLSAAITVQAAAPTALGFGNAPPTVAVAGDPIAAFTVQVQDQLGNVVATVPPESLVVSLHVGGAALQGDPSASTANGVASIAGLSYEVAETIVLRVTSQNYGTLDTPPIQVAAAASAAIVFDSAPPTVYYQNSVGAPFSVRFEDVYGNVVTQETESVTLTVPDLLGNLAGGLTRNPLNGVATFDNLSFDTPQTAALRFDAGVLAPLEHSVAVAPGYSDLALRQGAIRVVPAAPALAQPTSVFVDVANAGQQNSDALVSVYLDSVDPANLLGTASAIIGVGGVTTFEIPWTPSVDGSQSVFAVVDNRTGTEQTPQDNAASTLVTVGALAEDLSIVAGERIAWPGASTSVGITIRNFGASAATLTGASASSPWLTVTSALNGVTLQPGESIVALADLAVPLSATGAPLGGLPVVEIIDVDVATANDTWSGPLEVKLFDQPTGSATFTVVDASTGQPIGGALAAFQDLAGVYTTDAQGQVTVALPPGGRGIAVYKQGYAARSDVFDVTAGASSFSLALEPGEVLAIDSVEVTELSAAEIAARDVDVNDPVNNAVYDFVVAMQVGDPILVPNVELPRNQPGTVTTIEVERVVQRSSSSPIPTTQSNLKIYGTIHYEPGVPGRVETWIVVPGEVVVLKDFFEIAATVVNRADTVNPTEVQLRAVSAAIAPLPAGLALPDLDGVPQDLTVNLGTLDAGETASTTWVVRGDSPGTYQLVVGFSADLYRFGTFLTTVANTEVTSPFDVTLPSLTCEFLTPGAVSAGQTFDFGVRVINDGSSIAKQVRVNLRVEDLENCTLASVQSQAELVNGLGGPLLATVDLGDLAPGEEATATFQLVSGLTGVVVEERVVNGCQGDPSPGVTVAGPPTISTDPVDQTVCEGDSVTFAVVASGAVPITYQWYRGLNPIPGEEADTLTISPVSPTDAGQYSVFVTNPGGTTPSAVATLTVQPLPTADFAVSAAAGQAPLIVQFTNQSTGTVSSWAWDFDGDGTVDSTLENPTHTYASAGSYTVSLTVQGACSGDTVTRPAAVTVTWPPVVAAFSGLPTSGTAPLAVQFSDASTGGATAWAWDFDADGVVDSQLQNPSFTYTAPGTYTVALTATGPGGNDTLTRAAYVTVYEPVVAAFSGAPTSGVAPLTVQFGDASTGADAWSWDLDGDGVADSTAQNPSFTYTVPGTYTVSLTATGSGGSDTRTEVNYITVHEPVAAAFSGQPTDGPAPLTVQFSDASTGADAWSWDLDGNGTVDSTAQNPGFVYTTPGQYTVSLTATGPGGTDSTTRVQYITVHEPVVASFSGTPTSGTAPLTVQFTDTSTGADGWAWDFDNDGNVDSTLQHPSHVYTTPGTYAVSLLATGPGGTDTLTLGGYITVYEPPVIRAFTATPQLVLDGTQTTLQFDFEHGTGVIDNGVGGVTSGVDVDVVPPVDATTTYQLTVTNPANDSVSADVNVTSIPAAEVISFVATPTTVPNGQQIGLFSEFRGATTATVQPGNLVVTNQSTVYVTPPADTTTTYTIVVQNALSQAIAMATVTAGAVPQIVTQPADQLEPPGGSATFSVVATGSPPLAYQWFRDGVLIPGATQDTLTLTSVTAADAAGYSVAVGNAFGAVASDTAYLTLLGTCNTCSGGVVTIDSDILADFSGSSPAIHADPALLPYLSTSVVGPNPSEWMLRIDVGSARLEIAPGVRIGTGTVPTRGGSREAPGIEVRSSCGIVIHRTAVLEVESRRAQGGPIRVLSGGDVSIGGLVLCESRGDGGTSGDVLVASRCGRIRVSQDGLVHSDAGGDITLVTGGDARGAGGDIEIFGRVVAEYRDVAPTLRLVAFDGGVRVDSSRLHSLGLGVSRLKTSGVSVRARNSTPSPGHIQIQAQQDIRVSGNSLHHYAFPNPGAVAIEMLGNHGGGTIDVRSVGGSIRAFDRAFDNANHSNAHALNRIWAAGDIVFESSGALNGVHPNSGWGPSQMPVVDVRTVGNGTSGTNMIRSFGGSIDLVDGDAVILATPWSGAGTAGLNLLTASQGVSNQGLVLPADADASDDSGVSTPPTPPALFVDAASLGVQWWW